MMDASVALMNQYMMISSRFPPMPSAPTSAATTSTTATTENATNATNTETEITSPSAATLQTTEIETNSNKMPIDDGSEAGPSTSQKTNSVETLEIDGNIVTIEDIDPNDTNDTSELRRRRLQRFEVKSDES